MRTRIIMSSVVFSCSLAMGFIGPVCGLISEGGLPDGGYWRPICPSHHKHSDTYSIEPTDAEFCSQSCIVCCTLVSDCSSISTFRPPATWKFHK
jgi:hypothetical protein